MSASTLMSANTVMSASTAMSAHAVTVPRSDAGRAGSRVRRAGTRPRAELVRLDAALADLERAEQLLGEARRLQRSDPRASFELAHRAALKAAGVVVQEANRHRTRRLPLNVWIALTRCGAMHRAWAQEAEPMVAERRRLDARADALPDPRLLSEHLEATARRTVGVRAEVLMQLTPDAQADDAQTNVPAASRSVA